jgi:peroxiredoxin
MSILALVLRLLIAAIFFVAGLTKLFDQQGTRKSLRDFGMPSWAARPLRMVLPLAELAVAVLLIPIPTALWGSLGAITLLLFFIVGITVNLLLGRKPACNCFGQLHSKPIGWATLTRNCILIGWAGFVLWQMRNGLAMGVLGWRTGLSGAETVGILLGTAALVLIGAEGWISYHLLRQNGRLLLRMDALETLLANRDGRFLPGEVPSGLPIGSPAPAFELPALSGGSLLTLDTLRREHRSIILIFTDAECGPCLALLPDIAGWERQHAETLTIALISRGSRRANRPKFSGHRLRYVLLQKDREVLGAYQVNGTPGAVLIGVDGNIASSVAMGAQAIAILVAKGTGTLPPSAAVPTDGKDGTHSVLPSVHIELKSGDPAPSIKLPNLNGKIVDLAAFRGRETLVLFWNPRCGFCTKMLPDLRNWEENRPGAEGPQLLVVSAGTVQANRAMGLRSTVVVDQNFATGFAFHAMGTPAAVLVDAEGKIASGVANGAPAIFALANAHLRTPHLASTRSGPETSLA